MRGDSVVPPMDIQIDHESWGDIPDLTPRQRLAAVPGKVRNADIKRAYKLVHPNLEIAPRGAETEQKLRASLAGVGGPVPEKYMTVQPWEENWIKDDTFVDRAKKADKNGAAGPSGCGPSKLSFLLQHPASSEWMLQIMQYMSRGIFMYGFDWTFDGRIIAFKKGETAVRPIVVGECMYRIVASTVAAMIGFAIGPMLNPQQLAVGTRGGIEALAHMVRMGLDSNDEHVVATTDVSNCFGSLSRTNILERVEACLNRHQGRANEAPVLAALPLMARAFSRNRNCWYNRGSGESVNIELQQGAPQGDPLSMLACCILLDPDLKMMSRVYPAMDTHNYADDGIRRGTLLQTTVAGLHYEAKLASSDAHCNPGKSLTWIRDLLKVSNSIWHDLCEVLGLDTEVEESCSLSGAVTQAAEMGTEERRLRIIAYMGKQGLNEPDEESLACHYWMEVIDRVVETLGACDQDDSLSLEQCAQIVGTPVTAAATAEDVPFISAGVPCGSDECVTAWLWKWLEHRRAGILRVTEVKDLQSSLLLARMCINAQIAFLLRTVPPRLIAPMAEEFDKLQRLVAMMLCTAPTLMHEYEQCIAGARDPSTIQTIWEELIGRTVEYNVHAPLRHGGAGFLSAVDRMGPAFAGSAKLTLPLIRRFAEKDAESGGTSLIPIRDMFCEYDERYVAVPGQLIHDFQMTIESFSDCLIYTPEGKPGGVEQAAQLQHGGAAVGVEAVQQQQDEQPVAAGEEQGVVAPHILDEQGLGEQQQGVDHAGVMAPPQVQAGQQAPGPQGAGVPAKNSFDVLIREARAKMETKIEAPFVTLGQLVICKPERRWQKKLSMVQQSRKRGNIDDFQLRTAFGRIEGATADAVEQAQIYLAQRHHLGTPEATAAVRTVPVSAELRIGNNDMITLLSQRTGCVPKLMAPAVNRKCTHNVDVTLGLNWKSVNHLMNSCPRRNFSLRPIAYAKILSAAGTAAGITTYREVPEVARPGDVGDVENRVAVGEGWPGDFVFQRAGVMEWFDFKCTACTTVTARRFGSWKKRGAHWNTIRKNRQTGKPNGNDIRYAAFLGRLREDGSAASYHVSIIDEFGSGDKNVADIWDFFAKSWCDKRGCAESQVDQEKARFFAYWRARIGIAMARCNASFLIKGLNSVGVAVPS
jgi:hypothetical protein